MSSSPLGYPCCVSCVPSIGVVLFLENNKCVSSFASSSCAQVRPKLLPLTWGYCGRVVREVMYQPMLHILRFLQVGFLQVPIISLDGICESRGPAQILAGKPWDTIRSSLAGESTLSGEHYTLTIKFKFTNKDKESQNLKVEYSQVATGDPELPQDGSLPSLLELLRAFPEWESCGRTKKQGFVTRVNAASLSYDTFFADYMLCNEPVVIEDVSSSWRASMDWVDAALRTPNMDFLVKHFGASTVQVCQEGNPAV
eukprot:3655341-Pyramimonas_sp.AAC.1